MVRYWSDVVEVEIEVEVGVEVGVEIEVEMGVEVSWVVDDFTAYEYMACKAI